MNRKIGDIVIDLFGQISILTKLDEVSQSYDSYDLGFSLRPRVGIPVQVKNYRVIASLEDVLKLAEQNYDFKTKPERELTEMEKLQRDNRLLQERLERLEGKSQ